MSRRSKACDISPAVKTKVWARDGYSCILCGRYVDKSYACCHFISRAQGGIGIEENIFTACTDCHRAYDQTVHRRVIRERIRNYLQSKYPGWNEDSLYYKKYAL